MVGKDLHQAAICFFETVLKRRKVFRHWREFEESQWFSRDRLDGLQLLALRAIVEHTYEFCPYYRDSWSELALQPGELESLEDFWQWPVIERETVRRNRLSMRSTAPGVKLWDKATGGSSGVPLQFDYTPDSYDRRMAAWHRGYSWAGAEPGTKQLYLWGVPLGGQPTLRRWKDYAYNRLLYRRTILNTFELSEERVPEFLARHNRLRPEVLVAYTNPLYEFAQALKRRKLRPFPPHAIVVGAERLYDFQRRLVEDVFDAPVFETYGSREFMLIGAECDRHSGLHLTSENLLVEVLDDDGRPAPPGEEGNVVITDLYNYGMPFIRYANGDRAIAGWGECGCGRGLPLLEQVVGRRLDILVTPDGRRVPGEFFPHLIKDYSPIQRFQVVQEEPDLIVLKVVAHGGWREDDERSLRKEVLKVVGSAVRFQIKRVDEIALTPSGKLQVVVNKCAEQNWDPDVVC